MKLIMDMSSHERVLEMVNENNAVYQWFLRNMKNQHENVKKAEFSNNLQCNFSSFPFQLPKTNRAFRRKRAAIFLVQIYRWNGTYGSYLNFIKETGAQKTGLLKSWFHLNSYLRA